MIHKPPGIVVPTAPPLITHTDTIKNTDLLRVIEDIRVSTPGGCLMTSGGANWSSFKDIHLKYTIHYPIMKQLVEYITLNNPSPTLKYMEMWSNILDIGGYIGPHDHYNSVNTWAGVYYATQGKLQLSGKEYEFEPGDMVIFSPGDVHRVLPVGHKRVTVAFNLVA